jgi:serine protein kinase
MDAASIFKAANSKIYTEQFSELHWDGSFEEYLNMVIERPQIARTSFQRLADMILSYGTEQYTEYKKKITRYKFFSDPIDNGKDAVFGLDVHIQKLVNTLIAASHRYGPEKRVLLLHGPVGSAKSTLVRLLKKGIESYSRAPEGALYSYDWINLQDILKMEDTLRSPMNEEPLKLIPVERRPEILKLLNSGRDRDKEVYVEGDLNPACRYIFQQLMKFYQGDWEKVVKNHIRVRRLILSEKDRIGIGTFQPKDEKNQDSTELTGDINYRKIAEYGSDSDPRAFNFDGEFNIANRGIIEFVEVLKLEVAFLYDLLTASQEHKIKPKKFAQTDIDEVIIGHTNEPEYKKLQNNEFMEALRDRTVKIDVPYITRLDQEISI